MSYIIGILIKMLEIINKFLPKFNHVLIIGYPDTETSTIEVANFIANHYTLDIYFKLGSSFNPKLYRLLDSKVVFVHNGFYFWYKYLTSKFIFFTHGGTLKSYSKRQVVVNIWHGILYKKVGTLIGKPGIKANITVATSRLTQKMFADAFDVPLSNVSITGYPRNDVLWRTSINKNLVKEIIGDKISSYDKILIWLPTYRKSVIGLLRDDGIETGNPFYIENFDVDEFNKLLLKFNTLCIVKPHPMSPKYDGVDLISNLLFVDDDWILNKEISLYQLIGCSDVLISDVSSVIADYMLLNQPIICLSSDFDDYKNSRGFYFSDIENWLPSKIIKNQKEFFRYVDLLLSSNIDPFERKRVNIKNKFFDFQDGNNTRRLVTLVLGDVEY